MGTKLQEIYDSFFSKTDDDFTYTPDLVYQYFKKANGYSYKTVPEDLTYSLNTNNISLFVEQIASKAGNITLKYSNKSYTVSILTTDTLINIADKIVAQIGTDFTVATDYSNSFPIIYVSKDNTDLTSFSFIDTDNTSCVVIISQSYDGEYVETLGEDSIELLSLFMLREHYNKFVMKFGKQREYIGTKDFDKLPNLKNKYENTKETLDSINDQIFEFRQEFYTYKN